METEKTRRECKGNGINARQMFLDKIRCTEIKWSTQHSRIMEERETPCEATCFLGSSSLAFYQVYDSLEEQERIIASQLASDHTIKLHQISVLLASHVSLQLYIYSRGPVRCPHQTIFFSSVSSIIKHYSTIKAFAVQHAGLHCLSFTH